MPVGGFSHPVVVRESSARHCFLSLPRSLASLVLPVQIPTFSLVDTEKNRLLLSWAGEVHSNSIREAETHEEVYVSREVLRENGMSDGVSGVLSQVAVPPQCSSVSAVVASLDHWEILALNAEVAQVAFLNQVRVLGLGQSVPLWLEGGACVNLKVTGLEPPVSHLTLHPMSQVEVLPPAENDHSPGHTAINFAAAKDPSESDKHKDEHDKEEARQEAEVKGQTRDVLTLILEFMVEKLKNRQAIQSDFVMRKEVRFGARVVGMSSHVMESLDSLANHPSVIIISQSSVFSTIYDDKISFLASVRVIKSPKELTDSPNVSREEKKPSSDKKQEKSSKDLPCTFVCTAVVWENYLAETGLHGKSIEEISAAVKGGNCVVPSVLRRHMKLNDFSIIEIQTCDVTTKTAPVCVDVLPITPDTEAPHSASLLQNIKTVLTNITKEWPIVINENTLLEVRQDDGKLVDVLVRTRDGLPLHLTRKSVVLLDVTVLKDPPDIPHILSSTHDLSTHFQANHPYVGNQEVFCKLKEHILFSLDNCGDIGPQFALLQGNKGSGKTSLMESLMDSLPKHPHYVHCDLTSLKLLKGKKAETIEKRLQLVFREAIFYKPAVVFLDDIDNLVASGSPENMDDSGPLHSYTMQVVTVFKLLLDQLMEFLSESMCKGSNACGGVVVVASCGGRAGIHPLLVSPKGCHYFPHTFTIPPLNSEGRVVAFNAMLTTHVARHLGHETPPPPPPPPPPPVSTATLQDIEETTPRDTYESSHYLAFCHKYLAKQTEGFALPDLHHLSLRTYLKACDRWRLSGREESGSGRQGVPAGQVWDKTASAGGKKRKVVEDCDVESALQGYIPLALRGLSLSEKGPKAGRHGVGGLREARTLLEETLTWPAAHPTLFSKVKLRLRSGVLLYGPPGSGKTLLAHSIAAECHLNFIPVKGPELLSKYIGASEEAVRDAFERASCAKPCILFFDEFESIAPRRGHDSTGVTDRVVNQLLTQMDGVEGLSGVYVLAATSRPDLIDPALLRPGRLDKCVFCPMPTLGDRVEILQVLGQNMDLGEEIDWREVAELTDNFTGADLQGLLSSAQVLVGQEVLGDSLYEGVIPSEETQEEWKSDAEGDSDVGEENELMEAERDYCTQFDEVLLSSDSYSSIKEIVFDERGEKVVYKDRKSSSTSLENTREECVIEAQENSPAVRKVSLSQDLGSDEESVGFKVYQRHILAALREVRPSVTAAERHRYEHLYRSFNKSREGNFGQPSPGKRATLA